MDWNGLKQVLTRLGAPGVARLRKLWVDGGQKDQMKNRVFRRLLSKTAAHPFDLGAWYGNLAAITHFDNQFATENHIEMVQVCQHI